MVAKSLPFQSVKEVRGEYRFQDNVFGDWLRSRF